MQKLTIVIVDDSLPMRRFLTIFLEKKYKVITFSDSQKALRAIKKGLYLDAFITDFDMPNLSGLDLIQAVRKIHSDLPVAVISDSQESSTRIQSFDSGADEFITKPFNAIELELRIGNLLRNCTLVPKIKEKPFSNLRQFVRAAAF